MQTIDFVKDLLKWLTNNDSDIIILYGGTPEEDKDFRFATLEEDLTIEDLIEKFKSSPDGSKYAS